MDYVFGSRLIFVVPSFAFLISHRKPLLESLILKNEVLVVSFENDAHLGKNFEPEVSIFALQRPKTIRGWALVCFKAYQIFWKFKPHLIQIFSLRAFLYLWVPLFILRKTRILISFTGLGYLFTHSTFKTFLAKICVIFVVSLFVLRKHAYFAFQNKDDPKDLKLNVMKLRHRIQFFDGSGIPLPRTIKTYRKRKKIRLGFVGRLIADKGIMDFITLANRFQSDSNKSFLIFGDEDPVNPTSLSPEELMFHAENSNVSFEGFEADEARLFSQLDILIFPSKREGFPRAVSVALSYGVPVIAYDVPGCREVLGYGKYGLLVSRGDIKALENAILHLETQKVAADLSKRGRGYAKQKLTYDTVNKKQLEWYRSILRS